MRADLTVNFCKEIQKTEKQFLQITVLERLRFQPDLRSYMISTQQQQRVQVSNPESRTAVYLEDVPTDICQGSADLLTHGNRNRTAGEQT